MQPAFGIEPVLLVRENEKFDWLLPVGLDIESRFIPDISEPEGRGGGGGGGGNQMYNALLVKIK